MPLVAAISATLLMIMSGRLYDQVHTDVAYLVTHLYIMTALILCGMVKGNVKSRKSKDEPTGSGKVSTGTEGESSKDK